MSSNLPESLRKQYERAEELQRQLTEGEPPEVVEEVEEDEVAENATVAEAEPAEVQPSAAPEPTASSPTADTAALLAQLNQAEARYNTLRGKYESEVPRLNAQLEQLHAQHAQLMRLFEESQKKADADAPAADQADLTADAEQYGEDMVAMVERRTLALLQRMGLSPDALRKLESELSSVRETTSVVVQEVEKNAEQRMLETLQERLPEYRQIDNDPRFGQWLELPDPISGIQRADLYRRAGMVEYDPIRVELMMRQFVADFGLVLPSSKAPTAADPRAALAVPPRSTAAAVTPATNKKTWSRKDITDFYRDQMKGKYTPDEAKRIEAEIFEAQRAGLVS